jgi:hypothetical protein
VGPEGLTASTSVEMRKHSSRSLNRLKCPAAMSFARAALVELSSLRAAKLTRACYELDQERLGNAENSGPQGTGPTGESAFQGGFHPSS